MELNNIYLKNIKKFKRLKCEWCLYESCNYNNKKPVFKIFWNGKFNNHIMCEQCVYDKEYRRLVRTSI